MIKNAKKLKVASDLAEMSFEEAEELLFQVKTLVIHPELLEIAEAIEERSKWELEIVVCDRFPEDAWMAIGFNSDVLYECGA